MIYKQKLNSYVVIISFVLLTLCFFAVFYCIKGIFDAQFTVDYVSNIFLIAFNFVIIFSLINYLSNSNYKFTDNGIIIKTAFFKDPINYEIIRKIFYFATENELYIQIGDSDEDVIKINLNSKDINIFANELKKRLPKIPYEVSLKIDSDIE